MRLAVAWMRAASSGARFFAGPCKICAALLIVGVVLNLFGGDRPVAFGHVAERQFPHRQHAQPLVAEHADIDLAAFDILLGDRRRADPLVDEIHPLGKLVVAIDDGGLRNAVGAVLVQALDDQRQSEPRGRRTLRRIGNTAKAGTGMRW